jgi:hypothetical protein
MRHRPTPALALTLLLAGCAGTPLTPPSEPTAPTERGPQAARAARMVLPASVDEVAEESFGKAAWGRRGEFLLTGQSVSYARSAERLSLFESLRAPPAALSFSWASAAGSTAAECVGQPSAPTVNSRDMSPQPWTLTCRWAGAPGATLQIGEGSLREGRLSREGSYRRGELTIGLRSVHLTEGGVTPRATAVGYELLHEGIAVGSLELGRGLPKLRRPDPATPLGRAVTEAALALALVSEPG